MPIRVAFYTKYHDHLLGVLQLTPGGIVAHPYGERNRARLERVLAHNRPRGYEDDAKFLREALPRFWRDQCVVLEDGEKAEPGFEDAERAQMRTLPDGGA